MILVRTETAPDDIHGMFVSQGILTATGGMTSHAAVVGRQMGKPSIVGAGALNIDEKGKQFSVNGQTVKEGDYVSFDGLSGEVKLGQVSSKPSEILQVVSGQMKAEDSDIYQRFTKILSFSDKFRTLGIRANADLPDQAELAYNFGARGIGLCRTEHMFFGEGRIPVVQRMILANNEADRRAALDELLPFQRDDFYGVFKAMHGSPVTIRLIDPPLHEFLPKREDLMVEIAKLESGNGNKSELGEKKALLHRVEQLHEFNPMLGHRGVRLGITYPEITEMQTEAIISAACQLAKEGHPVVPEIMIPLVGHVKELRDQKKIVDRVAAETIKAMRRQGEVSRRHDDRSAARRADGRRGGDGSAVLLVRHQRPDADDVRLLARRHRQVPGHLSGEEDPGARPVPVARYRPASVSSWTSPARRAAPPKPDLKLGVCGEHGGDPSSIHFFQKVGLDYVSMSPYRVPVARLAAAQAALQVKVGD